MFVEPSIEVNSKDCHVAQGTAGVWGEQLDAHPGWCTKSHQQIDTKVAERQKSRLSGQNLLAPFIARHKSSGFFSVGHSGGEGLQEVVQEH